jgi:hypothetical protein
MKKRNEDYTRGSYYSRSSQQQNLHTEEERIVYPAAEFAIMFSAPCIQIHFPLSVFLIKFLSISIDDDVFLCERWGECEFVKEYNLSFFRRQRRENKFSQIFLFVLLG